MVGILNPFKLAEWFVIASFSLLMGIVCIGIVHILMGDPILNNAEWTGIGAMIIVCALRIISIRQNT